jgi:hypothetical protein
MIRDIHINKGFVAVIAGVAVFALACADSVSPTAPVATESQAALMPATANDLDSDKVGDVAIYRFWATAMGDPQQVIDSAHGDHVRLLVACRHSPEGPDTRAVFRFYGNMMNDGMHLWHGAEFYATVKTDWKDGRDWSPAYRVLKVRMPDAR